MDINEIMEEYMEEVDLDQADKIVSMYASVGKHGLAEHTEEFMKNALADKLANTLHVDYETSNLPIVRKFIDDFIANEMVMGTMIHCVIALCDKYGVIVKGDVLELSTMILKRAYKLVDIQELVGGTAQDTESLNILRQALERKDIIVDDDGDAISDRANKAVAESVMEMMESTGKTREELLVKLIEDYFQDEDGTKEKGKCDNTCEDCKLKQSEEELPSMFKDIDVLKDVSVASLTKGTIKLLQDTMPDELRVIMSEVFKLVDEEGKKSREDAVNGAYLHLTTSDLPLPRKVVEFMYDLLN